MKYLLDTHTLIWSLNGKILTYKKLSSIIEDPNNLIFVSIASVWEIAIKLCVNRISLNFNIDDLFNTIECRDYILLPIKEEHIRINLELPMIHRDPFDRLLVATAISENLNFITSDKDNQLYDVDWVWE